MYYRRVFLDNGLVFLTIVTQDRCPILVDNINAIKFSYISTLRIYHYRLVAYVVLPTHIHCIIKPREINDYSKIVKSFKYSFTKNVGLVKPTYNKLWQNRFWEHTIRSETDLNRHLDYIHYNPVKHNLVKSSKDWLYSSFTKFVKKEMYDIDWCNWDNKYKITELNFE